MKVGSAWRVRYRPSIGEWAECDLHEAGTVAYESCPQVRERHAFRSGGSKRGWYYFATTRQLKWCESRFEMRVLRLLDFDREAVAVAVQPFTLHYRDDAGRAAHTPDVFVRNRNGSARVVDARPARFADKPEFVRQKTATEQACAVAGWSDTVCSAIDPVLEANLDWLSSSRHQLVDPLGCTDDVLAMCAEPRQIGAVVTAIPPAALTRPVISTPPLGRAVGHGPVDPPQRRFRRERDHGS